MSIKSKLLAAGATLTLVGGLGLAGALTAGPAAAGTPSCGPSCLNTFNSDLGPGFVVDTLRQGEKVGQPIILFKTTNFDPAEDFTIAFQGTVADFFTAGLVDAATALHYGCTSANFVTCTDDTPPGPFPNLPAWEIEYAPFGVESGLCVGVAATAFQDEGVSLQPCGVSSKTVWIEDSFDVPSSSPGIPLINGSNTNFSQPFVLTYPSTAFPTDKPRPQIVVQNLTGFAQPGNGSFLPEISSVNSNQLWVLVEGVTDTSQFSP
jgi:hypothetical protein